MNRLYAVESMPTPTGSRADHRLPLRPSEIEPFARLVAAAVGLPGAVPATVFSGRTAELTSKWIAAVAKDLLAHKGSSLVIAGETQPPVVHAIAHAINHALGNAGRTVVHTDPVTASPVDQTQSLRELATAMAAGQVDVLVIVGGNPVYTAPADLNFAEAMGKVPLRVHLELARRRDLGAVALAHSRVALSGELERRPRLRRHRLDRPAAHRSALCDALGARAAGDDGRDA